MIGKLQSNKAKKAVKMFDYIHSLDNVKLASKIAQYEKELNKKIKLFIQVNLAEESQKSGVLLNDFNNPSSKGEIKNDGDETVDIYEKISDFTKIISPILLPLISGLSDLKEEELAASYSEDD